MKKTVSLLLVMVLFLSVLLSGCSFELRSIDSLMRPPHSSMENELKSSINKLLGSQISYRTPESGENHSAITLRDINGDDVDEAIVFYVNNDDVSIVRMCVLTQSDDDWLLVGNFAGNGSGILNVEFADLNSDNDEEIMVTWFLFDDKSQKVLSVYSSAVKQEALTVSACISEPYNLMTVADVYFNSDKQLLLGYFNSNRSGNKSTLKLIGIDKEDNVKLINETALDERITSLSGIFTDIEPGKTTQRFFIDAETGDGQCITQVFSWNVELSKFVSRIDDLQNPDLTVRSSDLHCRDIDDDGYIEIPLRKPMSEDIGTDISYGYLLVWCKLTDNGLEPCKYYVVNLLENYMLYFPDDWKEKVFVKSENDSRKWHFVNSNDEILFTLTALEFSKWDENSSDVTEMIIIQNETVYCCTVTQAGAAAGISSVDLENYFSLNI